MELLRMPRCPACGLLRARGLDDEKFSLSVISVGTPENRRPITLMVTCKRCGYEWSEPPYGEVSGEAQEDDMTLELKRRLQGGCINE